jgi:hypothetical protein
MTEQLPFKQIWLTDTEYRALPGELPEPICICSREFFTGQVVQLWLHNQPVPPAPPFTVDATTLVIAFYASSEIGVFLALGWPLPVRVLDLYAEAQNLTSGLVVPWGKGLLGVLMTFGLDGIAAGEKEEMRQLCLRGGPFSPAERADILKYCQGDADALSELFRRILPHLNLALALIRGRFMVACARMERTGVPIDTEILSRLRDHWERIKGTLIQRIDAHYDVYVPSKQCSQRAGKRRVKIPGANPDYTQPLSFSIKRWAEYLRRENIPWPRLESGRLATDDETFRQMAKAYPAQVGPIRELRYALSQLRLNKLAVGGDGRNRCLLSAFASKTGRNQPSNTRFIFGPACWTRSLIRPEPGRALAYIDWSAQEFGIAAYFSGDLTMQSDYLSGDPYLALAKRAGAVPVNATKASHPRQREQFKVCCGLAAMYGTGPKSLGMRLGISEREARLLLGQHRAAYRRFWAWSEAAQARARFRRYAETVFGWRMWITREMNPRSLKNFYMQAHGSEMLRLATWLATEQGISVCCPVHDALLVEASEAEIDDVVAATRQAMREASEIVLPNFPLRTAAHIVRHPARYSDERGQRMWETVMRLLPSPVGEKTG